MKYLFFFTVSFLITLPLLTLEWMNIYACFVLSVIFTVIYDFYCTSLNNKVIMINTLMEKLNKIELICTRMSTIIGEIRDKDAPKKDFNPDKFRKKNGR